MTDPKDAPRQWQNGLKAILDKNGVKSLADLIKKKIKPKPESKPQPRLPYVDKMDEPD